MNLTSNALLSSRPRAAGPAALAILYPKVGNVLRVPLRRTRTGGAHGCAQHPERQFIVWFNRMSAARPGFPMQIKSILLITGEPLCPSCHRALARFLSQYQLAGKLRLRSAAPAPCRCGDNCACGTATVSAAVLLDEVLQEGLGETPRRGAQSLPPATGPYRQVSGHHIHQSGAYAARGASAQNNPNHRAALAIAQNGPGFTPAQHDRASAVQRGTNRAAHGHDVDLRAGGVRVRTSGTGTLAAAPSQGFEDLKAYYALLAAGRSPAEALRLVNLSAQQLAAAGAVPVRVPSR
ncbi:hypothetical protein GO988_15805 [Hymenobacter sp. HMF4947]|uniref:Uncharacterized protein n=1 Tax=Hymenobacter ginkgonis TaxID=2682976 RepID=A0A7K1THL4_9BACT|nr:hypothetical protein [Hymenobacter ginkgonis]MVN77796.1 hypothetical protein [Hymenobacter ginkgonis]